MDSCQKRDCVI